VRLCNDIKNATHVKTIKLSACKRQYRGFPEVRPVFSPPMGAYFRWAFVWC